MKDPEKELSEILDKVWRDSGVQIEKLVTWEEFFEDLKPTGKPGDPCPGCGTKD